MSYGIAVGIYIATYILAFVLPLVFGDPGSVIRLAIFSFPVLLAGPRVAQRFTDGSPLLTKEFRSESRYLYMAGAGLIWLGHLLFFGSIGFAVYLAAQGARGVPVGLVTGYAIYPYLVGILLVELAFRQWSKGKTVPRWKSQRNSVYIIVGMAVAAQLTFNLTSDKPVDLLSYSEREALAWGNGYSKEVKHKAEEFYREEKRLPCADDEYIDVDSLLGGTKADRSKALSIEIFDCGRFVATIHRPSDGVANGHLLFVASPGDADAGSILEWQCFSPQFERIERHTHGRCTYDPSLADIIPAPVVPQPTVPQTEKPSSVVADSTPAPVAAQPTELRTEKPSRVIVDSSPNIQNYLDRLGEPFLWEDCDDEVAAYRLLKFDAEHYVAAVRISHNSQEGAYRSVTSSSLGKTTGSTGYVSEKRWARVQAGFNDAGFWHLRSERDTGDFDGTRIHVEACRNGSYHAVQRGSDDSDLAAIVRTFTTIGKLDWLEN